MKIAIIGGGNMGGSIARGLCTSKYFRPQDITISDPQQSLLESLKAFNQDLQTTKDNNEAIANADIVLLAVKPWLMEKVISGLKYSISYKNQIIVSIAATVSFNRLQEIFDKDGESPCIFRVIPNTAIEVGESMTFISSENATKEQKLAVIEIFNELGQTMFINENQIEGATALASCGIAFAMRYIRAASEGGVELGFQPDMARDVVLQTLQGAVTLLKTNGSHPEAEIDRVTTPGGITIKGLNEMEHAGFTSSVIKGLKAAQ